MSFIPKTWVDDQIVSAEDMNRIEQGISDAVSVTPQSLTDEQKTQARGNIGAAPDGYGLGGAIVYAPDNSDGASDANLIDATGFYLAFANAGGGGWNYVFHMQYPSDAALQFSSYVNDTTYKIRKKILGVWKPWEYVNPPMQLGVEYRTTERYLGKPVYVQAVSVGGLAAATEKIVVVKSSGCKDVIRAYAIGTDSVDNRRLTPNNDTDDCTFHCSATLYKTQADQSVYLVLEASRALTDVVAVAYYTKVSD